jgi:hypothetical protein
MTAHDDHYRKIKSIGVEPIEAMETAICSGVPEQYHQLLRANLNRAMACKHILRCGEKDQPKKEMEKAENYLFRAQHGRWMWEEVADMVLDMGGE